MNKKSWIYVTVSLVLAATLGVVVGRQSAPSATTTTTPSSTTSTTVPPAQPLTAMWPFAGSAMRFADPSTAAYSFAVDYLGFTSPLVGVFMRGDSRSGEVNIRDNVNGPVTVVMVRQLTADNTWWVLGSSSPSIKVASPRAFATISSPVTLRGQSTAFEAVVNVELRQDGAVGALMRTTVMGGSMGVMGPFDKSVTFPMASASGGALVFKTISAKDGHVVEASSFRLYFAK